MIPELRLSFYGIKNSCNYNNEGTMNVIELTGVVSSDALVYDQASFTEAVGFDAFG